MKIKKVSQLTGEVHEMDISVTPEHLFAAVTYWAENPRSHIQDAFPNLSSGEREFLLTGITPEEWDKSVRTSSDLSVAEGE